MPGSLFAALPSSYSVQGLNNALARNGWTVSFQCLTGELKCSLRIQDRFPRILHVTSYAESGVLALHVQQDTLLIEIPSGRQDIPLDAFRDGFVTLTAVGDGAVNGRIECAI